MTRPIRFSRRAALAAGVAAAALPLRSAWAGFPERPITWIVAYAAGGGSDTLARILAEAMTPALGQTLVIENKPGGATNIGALAAAKAEPDGYTVFTADNGTLLKDWSSAPAPNPVPSTTLHLASARRTT